MYFLTHFFPFLMDFKCFSAGEIWFHCPQGRIISPRIWVWIWGLRLLPDTLPSPLLTAWEVSDKAHRTDSYNNGGLGYTLLSSRVASYVDKSNFAVRAVCRSVGGVCGHQSGPFRGLFSPVVWPFIMGPWVAFSGLGRPPTEEACSPGKLAEVHWMQALEV